MLPKTAEYALRACVWLAQFPGETKPADALARATKTPRRYVHAVLQDLAKAKLIRSQPGPGGGYALARPAKEVTILAVVNAVFPIGRIRHCPLGIEAHTSLCPLHRELDRVYASAEQALGSVTLDQLLESALPVPALCENALGALPRSGVKRRKVSP